MQTERLYKVIADDPRLFKEHTEVKLTVRFERALTQEQQETFRQIVDAWSLLGQFAPMPDVRPFEDLYRDLSGLERRKKVFRSSYMKYCWGVEFVGDREVRVDFDLWALEQGWIDVLLNCLEAYHVQVAPIERIELKPAW